MLAKLLNDDSSIQDVVNSLTNQQALCLESHLKCWDDPECSAAIKTGKTLYLLRLLQGKTIGLRSDDSIIDENVDELTRSGVLP
jgi:hypothetical protein